VSEVDEKIRISPFSKDPAKVMVFGVVGSNGKKCPIIFVPNGKKITADSYQALLRRHVMPCLSTMYLEGNYMFQQDSAPLKKTWQCIGSLATVFAGSESTRLQHLWRITVKGQRHCPRKH
jgi:hypothetical protein